MSGFAAKAVIILVVITLIVVIIARFFRRVTPAKQAAARQRMPLLVVLAGTVLMAAGFTLGLAAFTSRYTAQLLPARIASVAVFLAGLALVIAFRNWYVEVGSDAVRFRTLVGREKRIAYRDIVELRTVQIAGRSRVRLRSSDGVRLSVDAGRYALGPLLQAAGRPTS